ncbi:hypothetical protein AX17_000618 [Amanita inopinata Kibby_2008]|nr:hypothetical protein AX17_000618 [Amanita inopinata Kibby_2008]
MNLNVFREMSGKEFMMRTKNSLFSVSPTTTVTEHPSPSDKPHPRQLKGQFIYKNGQRHHSYEGEKAPYPLSYDKNVLELESLDNEFTHFLKGSASFVSFKQPPSRVLDLGCGTGTWVIEAAKQWPNCTFVGFDLVNVQIPTKLLDPSLSNRIEWRHGNFLTTRLPFDDDEFDHVHLQFVAKGIPENKWGVLFEEVYRVLVPGGSVEVVEEDVVFPVLPRWFTAALRTRAHRESSVHLPRGTSRPVSNTPSRGALPHDHALLESLLCSVYEERFINIKPTAVLPGYFTSYFSQTTIGPVIHFPMPPLAPLQPMPHKIPTTPIVHNLDVLPVTEFPRPDQIQRPISLSFSSTISASTVNSAISNNSLLVTPQRRPASVSFSSAQTTSSSWSDTVAKATSEAKKSNSHLIPDPMISFKRFIIEDLVNVNEKAGTPLVPLDQLNALNERSLAMQLYRSYQSVLACQEAMWDELKYRLRNRRQELDKFGWDDDEELGELQARKKFEKLLERFRSDVHARLSLWCSLTEFGFGLPPRDMLSKAEYMEELRRRECSMEARKLATAEELQRPCRTIRMLTGYK